MAVAMRTDKNNSKRGNYMLSTSDLMHEKLCIMVQNSIVEVWDRKVKGMIRNFSPFQKVIKQGTVVGNCKATSKIIIELATEWDEKVNEP